MMLSYKEKLKQRITHRILDNEAHVSYSQEGEDVVLRRYLDLSRSGFYVDIGAHHPVRYSNTKYYYDKGWTGINIDADPELIDAFSVHRPRDINILAGVGSEKKNLTFHIFNHPAINTFDNKIALERAKLPEYKIVKKIQVKIQPLSHLLKKNLPAGRSIDFMSVDIEGKDLDALRSNDWGKFRPRYIMIECLDAVDSLESVMRDKITIYLREHKYKPVAKTLYTVIFGAY